MKEKTSGKLGGRAGHVIRPPTLSHQDQQYLQNSTGKSAIFQVSQRGYRPHGSLYIFLNI